MPPRRPKRMKMSANKDSEQPLEPGQTPTPRSSEEAHGSVDDGPLGSTTDTLAVPTDANIPPVVPSVHSMIENQKVWLVGSSILKHVQLEAFLRPGGLHLNIARSLDSVSHGCVITLASITVSFVTGTTPWSSPPEFSITGTLNPKSDTYDITIQFFG
uniref:Uncharacterized protein LOC111107051 n=1 Tax=Crassostrea virginica TaxID=6565 RepID=A0A8B8B3T0_CRAVI|nr:uncharacterized protein LOC111107051 [Crassostrea virginica]